MNRLPLFALFVFASIFTASATEPIKLAFRNSDVHEVLALYQSLTAKKIIYDNTVQGTMSLDLEAPVNREKAIELIEKSLFANGFSLIDISGDSVEVAGLGRNPRALGVPVYTKPEDIPKGERVFTFIIKLHHRDAAAIQQLLAQHIAASISTSVIADSKSGTIVVSERTSVIRSLLPIVAAFDIPEGDVK